MVSVNIISSLRVTRGVIFKVPVIKKLPPSFGGLEVGDWNKKDFT